MNWIFIAGIGLTLLLDRPPYKKASRPAKTFYMVLTAVTILMFIAAWRGSVPMPTHYFIQHLSPWFKSVILPMEYS